MHGKSSWAWRVLLALSAGVALGTDVPGWRRDGAGHYVNARPPRTWSAQNNVVWKQPLEKWSNASPIILGDRIFIGMEPSSLVCLSKQDGSILWARPNPATDTLDTEQARKDYEEKQAALATARQVFREADRQRKEMAAKVKENPDDTTLQSAMKALTADFNEKRARQRALQAEVMPATHGTNGYTTPTPMTDGRHVYALFGTGVVACYDLDGNRQWIRWIGRPVDQYGHSASPVFSGGRLIAHVGHTVHALDPVTGQTVWTATSKGTYGTPVALRIGEEDAVLTNGGDIVRARDGHIVCRKVGSMPFTSPIVADGVIYLADFPAARAVRLPTEAADSFEPDVLWEIRWKKRPHRERYYASPVVHDGLFYALNQRGDLLVLDARTGDEIYAHRIPDLKGTMYPSLTLADGLLFASSDRGVTVIFKPGREFEAVAVNTLEPFRSSPVFSGDRMYIRTHKHMICLGERP